jgi:hypothetical protein
MTDPLSVADRRAAAAIKAFGPGSRFCRSTLYALAYADLGTPEKLLAYPASQLSKVRGLGGKALKEIEVYRHKHRSAAKKA